MNRKYFSAVLLLLSLTLYNCNSAKQPAAMDIHTSQSSLDWEGTYKGMLPCADCEGISTVIQLHQNNTYQLHQKYEGKDGTVNKSFGTFTWTDDGRKIILKVGTETIQLQVGENRLFWLDHKGNRITGTLANNYILIKDENTITEKYWKLIELMGDKIKTEGNHEAYIILKQQGNHFNGNGGCNTINGSYMLKEQDGISFSNIISTEMTCKALPTEEKLIKALQGASSYLLKGDTLFLHKSRMMPLAKFEAVYLR